MDARKLAKYQAYTGVLALIDGTELLCALAGRSEAVPLFRNRVVEIRELADAHEHESAQHRMLTKRRGLLVIALNERLAELSAAAEMGLSAAPWLSVFVPAFTSPDMELAYQAGGRAREARANVAELTAAGLRPGVLEEITELAVLLVDNVVFRHITKSNAESKTEALKPAFAAADRALKQVRKQFRPALKGSLGAQWKLTSSFGRSNSSKTIAAPASQKLLAAPTEETSGGTDSGTAAQADPSEPRAA